VISAVVAMIYMIMFDEVDEGIASSQAAIPTYLFAKR
jgi:hypothetical protein